MKPRIGTLFLLLSLFVAASANRAWACASDNADHAAKFHHKTSEKSCCDKNGASSARADDSDTCDAQHSGSNCPCDHDNGACHCPGCGTVSHLGASFALETQPALTISALNASVQKQAFYFADHLPEAVYLPIWQPPKIGA